MDISLVIIPAAYSYTEVPLGSKTPNICSFLIKNNVWILTLSWLHDKKKHKTNDMNEKINEKIKMLGREHIRVRYCALFFHERDTKDNHFFSEHD